MKMICVGYHCDKCKHQRENIDGWICACDAFPDGIPDSILFAKDISEIKECNNGISFEQKENNILP